MAYRGVIVSNMTKSTFLYLSLCLLLVFPYTVCAQSGVDLLDQEENNAVNGSGDNVGPGVTANTDNPADSLFTDGTVNSVGTSSGNTMSKEEAKKRIEELLEEARSGKPGSIEKYNELIKAMEVISPQSSAKDIARFLRRIYYTDEMLTFTGITVAKGEPNISPELKAMEYRFYSLKKWQAIPDKEGGKETIDFAHALVGFDAYAWQPGLGGRAKGYLFTFLGDYGSQVFSWCGAKGAGDWNSTDHRGNSMGRRMRSALAETPNASLSSIVDKSREASGIGRYISF